MKLEGLIPPMVTPLDERRRLDKAGVRKMVEHLLKGVWVQQATLAVTKSSYDD